MSRQDPPDNDTRRMMEEFEREFGHRPDDAASDPQPTGQSPVSPSGGGPRPTEMRLSLPMSQPRAVYVLLAINVVMFLITEVLTFRLQQTTGVSSDDAFSEVLFQ